VAATGTNFHASASPTLKQLFREVTMDVVDPASGKTVYDVWSSEQRNANTPVRLGDLGGGSDFAGFINHLGIASSEHGFGGGGGVYHSAYDDFYYMSHFGDPGFKYHAAAAQVIGLAALRLADCEVLPFDYTEYGNDLLATEDSTRSTLLINNPKLVPAIDEIKKQTEALRAAGAAINQEAAKAQSAAAINKINRALMMAERDLVNKEGLPGRPWYRHLVYAPGINAGYGVTVLPGINEAIADHDWKLAEQQMALVKTALSRATATLQSASH